MSDLPDCVGWVLAIGDRPPGTWKDIVEELLLPSLHEVSSNLMEPPGERIGIYRSNPPS
jgi:hypothetical protein